ncbi:ABC transporter ATP-binding protein [Streptosporangium sp. NPDC000239]|uniref:ABC transporter ATP-binding protein n=1 Tax=Streptosporangium sp. NPDC000239 TaxID=3154248 RepID=UPI0033214BF6
MGIAWLTTELLDHLALNAPIDTLVTLAVLLAAVSVVTGLLPHLMQYVRAEMDRCVSFMAQHELFCAVERFIGIGKFEDPRFLDQLRLAHHAGGMPNGVVDSLLGVIRSAITITGFLGSLLLINTTLTVMVMISGVPVLCVEIWLSRRRARMILEISPVERKEFFYADLLSSVEAAKEIRLFGIGPLLRERMQKERRSADAVKRGVDRRNALVQSGLSFLASVVFGGGVLWAVHSAYRGALTVGGITMFIAAIASLQSSLVSLAGELSRIHHALLMFGNYSEVVNARPDLPASASERLPALRDGIEFRDVWFRYSEEHPWILRGVNLFIPHGKSIALVGQNGSGKSTLVKLLCRFYDPSKGVILWDGVDIKDVAVGELRERVVAVFQEYMRYDMTAAENIELGDVAAAGDRRRIEEAARLAGVHDDLVSLPQGYGTLLTRAFFAGSEQKDDQVGVVLSGGQWQRLAIARGLLRSSPDLMILDEPSAGLDAIAEFEMHARLAQHRHGRTSLLISHRLNTVRAADRIFVISSGEIVEEGDHDSLMDLGGEYSCLFTLQASGYQDQSTVESSSVSVSSPGPF